MERGRRRGASRRGGGGGGFPGGTPPPHRRVWAGGGVGVFPGGHPDARQTDWDVVGGQLKALNGPWRGYYLAYDPSGRKPGVFLSKEGGEGTTWERDHARGKGPTAHQVRAAEGKV